MKSRDETPTPHIYGEHGCTILKHGLDLGIMGQWPCHIGTCFSRMEARPIDEMTGRLREGPRSEMEG